MYTNPYQDQETPHRVVMYVRVSSEEQAQGHSLDAQERECREYLLQSKPHWELVGVYRDEDSGGSDNRPGFQQVMRKVYEGHADAILAHRLDRFSRNLHQILNYFKELEAMGVILAFAKDQFDFSIEEGRLQFHILAVFADWYLRNLSRETKKGKLARVLKGKHNNRPPIGYERGQEGPAIPVEHEAELICEAYELYACGDYTDRKIAQFLNEQSLRTRRNRLWSKDSVRELLQNEFYVGQVKYLGDLYPGQHEPIITQELFERVQSVRKSRSRHARAIGSTKRVFLLSGLIHCFTCGRAIRAQGDIAGRYSYYREASRLRGFLDCSQIDKSGRVEDIEYQMGEIMTSFTLPISWRDEIRRELSELDQREIILTKRRQLQQRLQRIARLYADGIYDNTSYERERDSVRKQLERLVVPEPTNVLEAGNHLETLQDVWPRASKEEQRMLCRLIIREVYIDIETRSIVSIVPNEDFGILFRYHPYMECDDEQGYQVHLPEDVLNHDTF